MGGFTSAIAPVLQFGKSVSPVISFATQIARVRQQDKSLSDRNRLEERQARVNFDAQKNITLTQQDEFERNRALTLNRALARQKANFAAQGLSTNDQGTVETVLQSIIDDSEADSAYRKQIDDLKLKAEELSLQQNLSRNLLDESLGRRRGQLSLASRLFA